MNKASILLGITTLAIVSAIALPQSIFAYRGDPSIKGPNHTEAKEQAIESANLSAFKAACTIGRMCEVVDTQEKLNTLKQMHEANENGDVKRATELRTSLGLGLRNGQGKGYGMGMGRNRSK